MKRLSFLLVTLVACAGSHEEAKPDSSAAAAAPGASSAPDKKMASGDVSFDLPSVDIKGNLYEPDALGRPGMPLIDPKRPVPIDKQRALVQASKDPVQKQAQAAVLATMLYRKSKEDKGKEKELWNEARQLLREVAQQVGDANVDEVTFRLLGSYEILLEDYAAAEKAWAALIDRDPKSKELPFNRAYLAYSQLKQFKNAEAVASIGNAVPDAGQPELAYVTAWAKWRTGDNTGAWQAIAAAAKGWGQNARREELEQNVLMFASRGGISFEQAEPVLALMGQDKAQFLLPKKGRDSKEVKEKTQLLGYDLLAKLGISGYGLTGQWADAIAALNKAVEFGGDTVPPDDRVVIRYSQADFSIKLDAPDTTIGFAKQTLEAITACGAKCPDKDKTNTVQGLYQTGRLFHILYATANDKRFYQPAHDLYAMTIPLLPPAQQAQAQQDATKLETTVKNIKPGTGTHDRGAMAALIVRHAPEVQTCFENVLQRNPKLGGNLAVTLESDQTGEIKGVATQPAAGAADLAAVATCVTERAKTWKLPKRGLAGTSRIKAMYALAKK
jgi:tetratricopeptide (TPR) repeat protein